VTASVEYSLALDATSADETAISADDAAHAAASIYDESASSDLICEAVRTAAEENDIPIGFLVRLLWQESRFRAEEISSAGAQGIAQFMPQTASEMGLRDPFDPLQAIPASAKFLRKLHDQFGNLGLAAAAYNAGGGRIEKWLSRRSPLPKETRAYVKIITGHKAEAWTDEESTVYMPTDLPQKAPCEGVGGLSRQEQTAAVNVDLTPAASAMVRKAEADEAEDKKNAAAKKLRVAASSAAGRGGAASRKANARAVLLAARSARKPGKQSVVRLASESSNVGRTKSSKAAREL
jgi:soluble lytic murein transglycosylase-like protein